MKSLAKKHVLKRMLSVLFCLSLVAALAACGGTQPAGSSPEPSSGADVGVQEYQWPDNPQDTYTLTVGVVIAPDTPSGQALLEIQKELEQRSNGAVTLDIYWESTLGSASEIAESVMTGTLDIGLLSSAVISRYTPAIDVFSLPFIIADRDQFKAVVDNCFEDVTAGMEETLGIPLGLWEFGFRHLCTRDKEILSVEDCAGLTIKVMDGQVYSETFSALGCIPSNIANSELVTALQQGVVDGAEVPLGTVVNQQHYTFCKYLTMLSYNYSVACPVMSTTTADALPAHVLALVREVFHDYRYYAIDLGQEYEDRYVAICEENGMTVRVLPEEEMQRFRDAVAPVWEKYENIIGKDLIDKVASISD